VLRHEPDNVYARIRCAMIRASARDAALRDGKQALADATRACELTHWNDFVAIETLAAAYAELGDFDNAVKWQLNAIEVDIKKDKSNATRSKELVARYSQHKPTRLPRQNSTVVPSEARK
jgi:tetratricopeptide (TPR) repeat protein